MKRPQTQRGTQQHRMAEECEEKGRQREKDWASERQLSNMHGIYEPLQVLQNSDLTLTLHFYGTAGPRAGTNGTKGTNGTLAHTQVHTDIVRLNACLLNFSQKNLRQICFNELSVGAFHTLPNTTKWGMPMQHWAILK